MEQQAVEVRMGQTHLGFVDAAKGLGMLAIIWGHMDYLWSTSSVWFSSFKIAVFYVVVGLLPPCMVRKARCARIARAENTP